MTNNKIHASAAFSSLTKNNEELCGDHVEIARSDDGLIVVLSDGLGSGVKANILSTITAKIISTMMCGGAKLEDTVETVAKTLPVCKVRKVAYSTFSIAKIYDSGRVCLTEFDSPACVFVRNGKIMKIDYEERSIAEHTIRQAHFNIQVGDLLVLMTDGVIYAGLGKSYPLGWGFQNAAKYIADCYSQSTGSKTITALLCRKCRRLYNNRPGDDTTAVAVKIESDKTVNLFSGPPVNQDDDERMVKDFLASEGKKVICGGTSAGIVSRITGKQLIPSLTFYDIDIPPTASMEGIDLVTEGAITLERAVNLLSHYKESGLYTLDMPDGQDGASRLARLLLTDCTRLNLYIGIKRNPAHTDNDLASDLGLRALLLNDLYNIMQEFGKTVTRKYY